MIQLTGLFFRALRANRFSDVPWALCRLPFPSAGTAPANRQTTDASAMKTAAVPAAAHASLVQDTPAAA